MERTKLWIGTVGGQIGGKGRDDILSVVEGWAVVVLFFLVVLDEKLTEC